MFNIFCREKQKNVITLGTDLGLLKFGLAFSILSNHFDAYSRLFQIYFLVSFTFSVTLKFKMF